MANVIELKNLQFAWPKQANLLDIADFTLGYNEKMFLKGPSGSGKTTLLGLLSGVLKPNKGVIQLLGQDLSLLSSGARDQFRVEHIGYIFQQFNLLPFLSVEENVLLPCYFSKRRTQYANERFGSIQQAAKSLLTDLGLDKTLFLQRADQLSIGQQQRVAAARALIGSPELIIADEPTSALDTETRESFIKLLFSECNKTGSSLLFVSHDQTLTPLFDRCLSLYDINQTSQSKDTV
ncbi:ABC transporter ATP-binding protein [Entomomonas asaccharolytica]